MRQRAIKWIARVSFLALFPLTLLAEPDPTYEFHLRMLYSTTLGAGMDQSIYSGRRWASWLSTDWAFRASQSQFAFETLDYSIDVKIDALSFLVPAVRVHTTNRLPQGTGATTYYPRLEFFVRPMPWFSLLGSFGWYERMNLLSRIPVLPVLSGVGQPDHDFAFSFGLGIYPAKKWELILKMSSVEEMEIFRLNNLYFYGSLRFMARDNLQMVTYLRYRLLMGFGRLDELLIGAGFRFPW